MKSLLPLLFISLLVLAYRVAGCFMDGIPVNSTPYAALFFCAVYYLGMRGLMVSSLVWILSYPVLSLLQGYAIGQDLWASVLGFSCIVGFAFWWKHSPAFKGKASLLGLLLGSVGCAVFFYFLTNIFSWMSLPIYEKTWEGFAQAQWLGHPDLPLPTWAFLRNSVVGNVLLVLLLSVSQPWFFQWFPLKNKAAEEELFMEEA